jgi:hypothetical protein
MSDHFDEAAFRRQLLAETQAVIQNPAALDSILGASQQEPVNDPRKAPPIGGSDSMLAVKRLMRLEGLSEGEASATVLKSTPEQVAAIAAEQRAAEQAKADAETARAYELTPEGMRERAAAIREQNQQRATAVEDGRLILSQDSGLAVEAMSDDDVLQAVALVRQRAAEQAEANSLDANLKAIEALQQRREGGAA